MRTIGSRLQGRPSESYPALCAYCGVPWPRSKLTRDGAGNLVCPDEGRGRDALTLSRLNAMGRPRHRRAEGRGGALIDSEPAAEQTWGDVLGISRLTQWCRSDFWVTETEEFSGVGVSPLGVASWGDRTTKYPYTASGAARPTLIADDGEPYLRFNGSTSALRSDLLLRAPTAATPFYLRLIFRQNANTSGRVVATGIFSNNIFLWVKQAGGALLRQENPFAANANANAPLGAWRRLEAYFSFSTSDFLKIGSVNVTGTSSGPQGTAVTAGSTIGAQRTNVGVVPSTHSQIDVREIAYATFLPTAVQSAALDAADSARYGPEVLS